MKQDGASKFEARLALAVFLVLEVRAQLEAGAASLHKGSYHIRVTLNLLDVCDAFLSDVVFDVALLHRLDQTRCMGLS